MQIWIDADACPGVIKEILYRACGRKQVELILVANQPLKVPPSPIIRTVQVPAGFDVADNYIVQNMSPGDLVITADIPLADEVIDAEGHAINPRGTFYTKENIKQRLTMRNFMEELRSTGQVSGGPPPLNHTDRQAFANALDRFLAKHCK
jgi:uncharacterized protein